MTTRPIYVPGLRELARDVKELDLNKPLGEAHKAVGKLVIRFAEKNRQDLLGRFPSLELLKMSPSASKTRVAIRLSKPFAHASEWGAKTHVVFGRRYPQRVLRRPVWPDWGTDGHLVHPVLRDKRQLIADEYTRSLDKYLGKTFSD